MSLNKYMARLMGIAFVILLLFGTLLISQSYVHEKIDSLPTGLADFPKQPQETIVSQLIEREIREADKEYMQELAIQQTIATRQAEQVAQAVQLPKDQLVSRGASSMVNPRLPMPIEHQRYLYSLCKSRGLDYQKTLAIIFLESGFNPNAIGGKGKLNYGYFQVNKINHDSFAKELHTENQPLDPYVNLNWGTHLLSQLLQEFKSSGLSGEMLQEAVLGAYSSGLDEFKQHGASQDYLNRFEEAYKVIIKY